MPSIYLLWRFLSISAPVWWWRWRRVIHVNHWPQRFISQSAISRSYLTLQRGKIFFRVYRGRTAHVRFCAFFHHCWFFGFFFGQKWSESAFFGQKCVFFLLSLIFCQENTTLFWRFWTWRGEHSFKVLFCTNFFGENFSPASLHSALLGIKFTPIFTTVHIFFRYDKNTQKNINICRNNEKLRIFYHNQWKKGTFMFKSYFHQKIAFFFLMILWFFCCFVFLAKWLYDFWVYHKEMLIYLASQTGNR